MQNIHIAILSGLIVASISHLVLFVARERRAILSYFRNPKKYDRLTGKWHQYHVTHSKIDGEFWSHHVVNLEVSSLRKLSGTTVADRGQRYEISGQIERENLRMEYSNPSLDDDIVIVWVSNILDEKEMVGRMMGKDFDLQLYCGPIIFSRTELADSDLTEFKDTHRR